MIKLKTKIVFKKTEYPVVTLLIAGFLFSHLLAGQSGKQTIVFSDNGKAKGKIYIAWYNKEDDFAREDKIYRAKTVEVTKENTSVGFENIAPGTYAVAAFLDENDNGKMDTNLFGIPKEKYGFSNNVRPLMRAATFKEASFTVTNEDKTIHIRLK